MALVEYNLVPPISYRDINASEQEFIIPLGLAVAEANAEGRRRVLQPGRIYKYPVRDGLKLTAKPNEQGGGTGVTTYMSNGETRHSRFVSFPPTNFIFGGEFTSEGDRTVMHISTVIAYEPENAAKLEEHSQEKISSLA